MIADDDPTHLNDIEVVTPELARKIDGVEAGDLHMLAIINRQTGQINWHQDGPWVRQHDPDITPEGNILVFNNGVKDLAHDRVAGSNMHIARPGYSGNRNHLSEVGGRFVFHRHHGDLPTPAQ